MQLIMHWRSGNKRGICMPMHSALAQRETQVERARIEQLENQERRLLAQRERIDARIFRSSKADSRKSTWKPWLPARPRRVKRAGSPRRNCRSCSAELSQARETERERVASLSALRTRWQNAKGSQVSIEALQQAALGKASGKVTQWLAAQSLDQKPRLAQQLRVDRGWERAVETVLGSYLQAVCVDGIDSVAAVLDSFDGGHLALVIGWRSGAPAAPGRIAACQGARRNRAAFHDGGSTRGSESLGERHSICAGDWSRASRWSRATVSGWAATGCACRATKIPVPA